MSKGQWGWGMCSQNQTRFIMFLLTRLHRFGSDDLYFCLLVGEMKLQMKKCMILLWHQQLTVQSIRSVEPTEHSLPTELIVQSLKVFLLSQKTSFILLLIKGLNECIGCFMPSNSAETKSIVVMGKWDLAPSDLIWHIRSTIFPFYTQRTKSWHTSTTNSLFEMSVICLPI